MKLQIVKRISLIMSVMGIMAIFISAFIGKIKYGWLIFIASMLVSGIMNYFLFRCPHCGKAIPANISVNQKYCPLCGKDLEMTPSVFSYYRRCARKKDGTYRASSIVGLAVFVISTVLIAMIVIAILGFDSIFKGTGRILIIISIIIGILLGIFCRCIAGSAVKIIENDLYFSKFPFRWKRYDMNELKVLSKERPPFYHVIKGYIIPTSDGILAIPVATYRGGEELLERLTELLEQPMVDVVPDMIISKHSEEGRKADEKLKAFLDN